jgi:hypothetical protein
MGSGLIEVQRLCFEKPGEVLLMKDQEVIQTFSSHTSQKAFTDGICLRCLVGRAKHFDACAGYLAYLFQKEASKIALPFPSLCHLSIG